MHVGRVGAAAATAALVAAPIAAAHVVERFRLSSDPDARGLSPPLTLVIRSPLDYERETGGTPAGAGSWRGPRYYASLRPSRGGVSMLRWSVDVARAAATRSSLVAALEHGWPVGEEGREQIERSVRKQPVGTITATWLLARAPGDAGDARYEAVLGIPLCGRTALVRLETPEPSADSAGGLFGDGDFVVGHSVRPSVWNRTKILTTLAGVSLAGNLPAGRVLAVRRGRALRGRVTDCNGHPVAGARVWLEREQGARWARILPGTADAEGAYSFRAGRPGRYRVSAGAASSPPHRLR